MFVKHIEPSKIVLRTRIKPDIVDVCMIMNVLNTKPHSMFFFNIWQYKHIGGLIGGLLD